ncbi:MAG: folylpolyglutamate synthase/dihydrofolate synthase family protein [Pseudomonadota bacterium]
MPLRSLQDWLEHLLTLHPSAIELGLERVAEVADRLYLLSPRPTVVTVAGTNGKGTTTGLLEAIACDANRRVGTYTSPHLLRYNERIRIDGLPVDDMRIVAAFEAVEAKRGSIPLTYFEFGTLAALRVFADQLLDVIILEVGLGGRLDATNIVDPDIAIITSIALDHQEWLGNDRETIGAEKAGILRQGIPAIVADRDPPASVIKRATALECALQQVPTTFSNPIDNGLRAENVFAAVSAASLLGIDPGERLERVLATASIPGRLQQLQVAGRSVILDVAHNPAAVTHLCHWLRERGHTAATAVFAALSDKDVHAMIGACKGVFSQWFITDLPDVERSLPAAELAAQVMSAGVDDVVVCSSMGQAWEQASVVRGVYSGAENLPQSTHPPIVVFGSFHTVAAFMSLPVCAETIGEKSVRR